MHIGTLSFASNIREYALPVDMFVRFGAFLALPSSQPTLLVENGRTLTWCGGIKGVKNLLIGANGKVQTDYTAHTGTDTRDQGNFWLVRIKKEENDVLWLLCDQELKAWI